MPPILSMALPAVNGEVDVKTAWIPGFDGFAIKVSPGFFDNPKRGLPSLNGLMILFSATTGLVEALFLDNGYLTDVRTAAAGAVAARHMAPATVETAGVLGTGVQARLQLAGRPPRPPLHPRPRLGPRPRQGRRHRRRPRRRPRHRRPARARPRPPRRREPARRHHHPGPRTDPAGRLAPPRPPHHRHGLRPVREERARPAPSSPRADLYVCDRATQAETLGELRTALAAGLWTRGTPPELGAVVAGATPGRPSPDAITVCDLTGTGAQDTAIATHALAAARAARRRHPHPHLMLKLDDRDLKILAVLATEGRLPKADLARRSTSPPPRSGSA